MWSQNLSLDIIDIQIIASLQEFGMWDDFRVYHLDTAYGLHSAPGWAKFMHTIEEPPTAPLEKLPNGMTPAVVAGSLGGSASLILKSKEEHEAAINICVNAIAKENVNGGRTRLVSMTPMDIYHHAKVMKRLMENVHEIELRGVADGSKESTHNNGSNNEQVERQMAETDTEKCRKDHAVKQKRKKDTSMTVQTLKSVGRYSDVLAASAFKRAKISDYVEETCKMPTTTKIKATNSAESSIPQKNTIPHNVLHNYGICPFCKTMRCIFSNQLMNHMILCPRNPQNYPRE